MTVIELSQVLYPTLIHSIFSGLLVTEGRVFSHIGHSGGVM